MKETDALDFDVDVDALRPVLAARRDEFARAVIAGGRLDDYKSWQASLLALEAALAILDSPGSSDNSLR